MPTVASPTIAVAAATAFVPVLPPASKVAVAIVFYTNVAGLLAQAVAAGSGTRDIDISRVDHVEGGAGDLTMPITDATVDGQAARTWKTFDLGPRTPAISVVCGEVSTPGGATHYRIWVAV